MPHAQIDAVVNSAAKDEHGWDYIVDLTPPLEMDQIPDLATHLIQCFAQIKSTSGHKLTAQLKLSNAVKMAKSSNPVFLFLIRSVSKTSDVRVYGKHIWEEHITEFLKVARQHSVENPNIPLRKRRITVNFCDDDLIVDPLSDWMYETIQCQNGNKYTDAKCHLIENVGYKETREEVSFESPRVCRRPST